MKDYEKMIKTVKALEETFGKKEFTAKDYAKSVCFNSYEVYCTSKVCCDKASNYMVKKVREEDFITKNGFGEKIVGTRYYYEVNDNFVNDLRKDLANEIKELNEQIKYMETQIRKIEKRISEKQELIATFERIQKRASWLFSFHACMMPGR